MNNFTNKDEQTFLNACAALNVEPKVMRDTLKECYEDTKERKLL